MKKLGLYEWSIIIFFILLPIIATAVGVYGGAQIWSTAFKWFVFSGIGLRLGTAGIKQAVQPSFTAQEIFKIKEERAQVIVRELGFANICFGIIGIVSFWIPMFRIPAAVAGGLYFGLAGLLHVFKKKESNEEIFAMISDLYIFLVLLILLIINIK